MEKTLVVINQMEKDGVIGRYAIGGAIAATLYIEPIQTYDLDIFITLPAASESILISLSPLYDYLAERGYSPTGECILVEGWPVQFLPAFNQLMEEALENALDVHFGTTPTHVFSAEYLAAIMVNTGRPKDHARLCQFLEADVVNREAFLDIVTSHNLTVKWDKFRRRFLNEKD